MLIPVGARAKLDTTHCHGWRVFVGDEQCALIVLDDRDSRPRAVIFSADDADLQRDVLALALAVHRAITQRLAQRRRGETVEPSELQALAGATATQPIPSDIAALDLSTLRHAAQRSESTVVRARYTNTTTMLAAAVTEVARRTDVCVAYDIGDPTAFAPYRYPVTLSVSGGRRFRFWRLVGGSELDIVPVYHPGRRGKHAALLINGDTNALINGGSIGVPTASAPPEARAEVPPAVHLISAWEHMRHPFRAEGPSFAIEIDFFRGLSQEAHDVVVTLLCAALEHGDAYVAVSGGFQPPFSHAQSKRGCEASCVWQYCVLEDEGESATARVPSWFSSEGWLKRYAEEIAEYRAGGNPRQRNADEHFAHLFGR